MNDSTPQPPRSTLVVFVRDLLISSRITAAAREANVEFKLVRDAAGLADAVGTRLVVDLNQPGAIDAAVEWRRAHPGAETIGFASHVDQTTIAQAKSAGIDRVLARGRFVEMLPELISG